MERTGWSKGQGLDKSELSGLACALLRAAVGLESALAKQLARKQSAMVPLGAGSWEGTAARQERHWPVADLLVRFATAARAVYRQLEQQSSTSACMGRAGAGCHAQLGLLSAAHLNLFSVKRVVH